MAHSQSSHDHAAGYRFAGMVPAAAWIPDTHKTPFFAPLPTSDAATKPVKDKTGKICSLPSVSRIVHHLWTGVCCVAMPRLLAENSPLAPRAEPSPSTGDCTSIEICGGNTFALSRRLYTGSFESYDNNSRCSELGIFVSLNSNGLVRTSSCRITRQNEAKDDDTFLPVLPPRSGK